MLATFVMYYTKIAQQQNRFRLANKNLVMLKYIWISIQMKFIRTPYVITPVYYTGDK